MCSKVQQDTVEKSRKKQKQPISRSTENIDNGAFQKRKNKHKQTNAVKPTITCPTCCTVSHPNNKKDNKAIKAISTNNSHTPRKHNRSRAVGHLATKGRHLLIAQYGDHLNNSTSSVTVLSPGLGVSSSSEGCRGRRLCGTLRTWPCSPLHRARCRRARQTSFSQRVNPSQLEAPARTVPGC